MAGEMKTEHVPIDRVVKLVAAARYAVEHSGDHGCEWCKSRSCGCQQCEAYSRLQVALKSFDGVETPDED
jgi:hypothetical protein